MENQWIKPHRALRLKSLKLVFPTGLWSFDQKGDYQCICIYWVGEGPAPGLLDTYWDIYGPRSKGKPRGSIQIMRTRVTVEFCNEILGSTSKNFSLCLVDRHFC